MARERAPTVRVWDPFVRVCHWSLVAAFAVAYATEDELVLLHVWSGYLIGVVVAARVAWGLVGTRHARFSDFVVPPRSVLADLRRLATLRPQRHLGHTPAGGAMIVALLVALAATVASGIALYGARDHAGPLAPVFVEKSVVAEPGSALVRAARADGGDDRRRGQRKRERSSASKVLDGIHEFLADLTLVLVLVHVAGVAVMSVVHRENLVAAMVTGEKRA